MKKKIYFMIFVIFATITSCSKESFNEYNIEDSQNSPLINELSIFNDSLIQKRPISRATYKQRLDRMSIVVFDAIGAYSVGCVGAKIGGFIGHPHIGAGIGALIGGAYSSYKCYRLLNSSRAYSGQTQYCPIEVAAAYVPALKQKSLVQDNLPQQITLNFSEENVSNIEIGAKHNIIVRNLQTNNLVLDSETKKFLSKEEISILNSKDFIAGYDSVTNALASCAVKGEIPKSEGKDVASLLMNLFATILETYPENVNDTEFIINKYIDAVQKTTELSVEEKENIYKALSVAASSYEFWNNL